MDFDFDLETLRLSDGGLAIAAAIASLLFTFGWLFFVIREGQLVNQIGFLVGLYGIMMAIYVQFSPRIAHPLAICKPVEYRVPITLYMVGSSTIFYAIRIVEIESQVQFNRINPLTGAIGSAIIVGLVTGLVVHSYLDNLDAETIERMRRSVDTHD